MNGFDQLGIIWLIGSAVFLLVGLVMAGWADGDADMVVPVLICAAAWPFVVIFGACILACAAPYQLGRWASNRFTIPEAKPHDT